MVRPKLKNHIGTQLGFPSVRPYFANALLALVISEYASILKVLQIQSISTSILFQPPTIADDRFCCAMAH